ncbi:MAG: hypothetical protein K1Y02_16950 [Candidatus Hydrogenedentes bacterium]|nr:hypothetical protein [Candidatus Hydrogenedentota bacterium]
MQAFPALDPIPLPAPVWLFVVLHTVTLALHFFAVHFLVGGLTLATIWSIWGRLRKNSVLLNASGLIAHRLPVVMTYVINFGVPPLLFTQVLYGRALYTSSVLIGVWWISVVALLMISYSSLYLMSRSADRNRFSGWAGLIALVVVLKIGMIYSANMTLMLRPDLWVEIYRTSPRGLTLGFGDPTVMPRWLFMMLGSIGVCGIALVFLSLKSNMAEGVGPFLRKWAGRLIAAFTVVQIGIGIWVYRAQPAAVQEGLTEGIFYRACAVLWLVTAVALVALGGIMSMKSTATWKSATVLALASFVNVVSMVLVRDGIRFVSLDLAGFNVWDQAVSTNWSTVILFLVLFVAGIGVMGWLISVVAKAKPVDERYA